MGPLETSRGRSHCQEPGPREVTSEICGSYHETGGRIAFGEGYPGAVWLGGGRESREPMKVCDEA